MKMKFSLQAMVASSALLIACGGDSTSTKPEAKDTLADGSSVETIYDLGKCTSDRIGDVIFVEEEGVNYECTKKDWKDIGEPESSASKEDKSSSSKVKSSESKDDDSSSSKDKSSDSKDDESSSSKDKSSDSKDSSSESKKDDSSSSTAPSSSSVPESSSSVQGANEIVENVAISKKTFTGVAEKGPFASGTAIKLSELDDVLDPTGTTFEWEVTSELGEYTSAKVTLKSQYALMQANGYYYNENTYKKSAGQLTLKSLVDLSDRNSANINVLGHLAHKRIINLFAESGKYKNVPAAKAAAEKEVLAAFGWSGNNHAFEDLSIFGGYEDDAKLLAASILLQGGLSDADLTSRLTTLATDFEDDGRWSDSAAKVAMADWAMKNDSNLTVIRTKLTAMNSSVPNFEKYISMFVGEIYGIGVCDTKQDGMMIKMTNAYSDNLGKTYVCDGDRWRLPTSIENSFKTACTKGNNKKTYTDMNSSSSPITYVCDGGNGNWRKMGVYDFSKSAYLNSEMEYGEIKDSRDGKTYKTITIGLQTWMAENLNYYDEDNANLVENAWCYKNVKDNCEVGGRLYSWTAAMNLDSKYLKTSAAALIESPHRGLCPEKWHVPDTAEWRQLKTYVAKMETASTSTNDYSGKLKSSRGWVGYSTIKQSTDEYGFSAIPTGAYYGIHADPTDNYSRYLFDDAGYFANFWSANEASKSTGAIYWFLDYRYNYISYYYSSYNEKDRGFSLRCVKDKE